ncbi:hypothetical protein [Streptomyces europaeiscabiei]|uniref:hypothetical protein n=1 Tax=Streptomyces europaeiscabiei TaxID=146819 RepID=UPI00299FB713|nr:hypothetical protein [Streptomyces europaeiscabiei]MDX3840956.1 hypothetical protein [Streptomyces europaeiscabiei]MDX3864207.1 hypothetical protein [Streptomyces europaeiscabiei]MDX3871711.1 hypothetical protein [Streptomyces europaeiscabiei]
MPRGRHRHSPPLHRLLPPTAIAGVSLVCALGPWLFSEPSVLRVTAAVAAATAAVGAAVMRRWDVEAGKRVADLTRARASDEWRHEEKAAELETDLDESRELRTKLEHKLRAKRTELAGLRNEHAALLRRYATAETERASALEGRRLLEIEAIAPEEAPELPAAGAGEDSGEGDEATTAVQASPVPPQGVPAAGAPWASWETASKAAATAARSAQAPKGRAVAPSAEAGADAAVAAEGGVDDGAEAEAGADVDGDGSGAKESGPAVFSPSGSALFLRANSALDRIITQRGSVKGSGDAEAETEAGVGTGVEAGAEAQAGIGAASEGAAEADADGVVDTDTDTDTEAVAVAEDGAAPAVEVGGESVTAGGSEAGSETETVSATATAPGFEPEPEPEPEAGAEADARGDAAEADAAAEAGVESEGPGTEGENASEVRAESAGHAVADSADVQTEESGDATGDATVGATVDEPAPAEPAKGQAPKEGSPKGPSPKGPSPKGDPDGPTDGGTRQGRSAQAAEEPVPVLTAEEDGPAGKSVAVRGHERAAASPVPVVSAPALSTGAGELTRVEPSGRVGHVQQAEPAAPPMLPAPPPAGHFTVPTAVAVVPAAPQRRAAVEGGFDFFGTQNGADALEAMQNEDLADVVGQEALALHKAESEAQFKLADEATRGIGQVIDLTAHDETEQIDVQGLRTAAS